MKKLDWSLIQSFVCVAEQGSLSQAAKVLGVTQPTLSRQMQLLEEALQLNLFARHAKGLTLTEHGSKLIASAQAMLQAADQFERLSFGEQANIAGTVRIAANEIVAIYLLPKVLATLRQRYPQIQIELDVSNESASLSKRDADIALRMYDIKQPDLLRRKLADMSVAAYAHPTYLANFTANPQNVMAIFDQQVIGFDRSDMIIAGAKQLGFTLTSEHFALRCDNMPVQINLARAGAGIVLTHTKIGDAYRELTQVPLPFELPSLPLWLVCHKDVQSNLCIRTVMDVLTEQLADDPYKMMLL